MSKNQIDKYLASLEQPKRGTLEALRRMILEIIPEAEQRISYSMPAFRVQGKVIAGFAAFKNHLSYLPHSGSVFPKLGDALSKYKTSPGALQFPVDKPLPKALVKKLIAIRMKQALGASLPHAQRPTPLSLASQRPIPRASFNDARRPPPRQQNL